MRITRIAIVVAAVGASVALAAPALAHVTANPNEALSEGRVTTFFRVGHGCEGDGPDTTRVSIQIPDGVLSVGPEDEPGWSVETEMRELDEPIESEGGEEITEVVSEVTWTSEGEPLDTHHFREFGLSLNIAAPGEEVLYFPTVQRCEQGSLRWVNIPPSVEEWGDTEDPAPFLELAPAEEETDGEEESDDAVADGAALSEEQVRTIAAEEADGDSNLAIAWFGVILGAIGVAFGLTANLRARRRAS